ncbi:MAG: tRNA (adenosine(37)-N6)-threonylcarbamoyltransferase complex ATPase subunit type 1 TsaE [Microgenomates group bacterium]
MDKSEITITKNAEETQKLGEKLADRLIQKGSKNSPHIICLYGDLGMGKTTFVQGVAKGLGLTSRLLSPTFIIVRRQQLSNIDRFFFHLDLYRLTSEQSIQELGIQEMFNDEKNIVIIEWAERLGRLLPEKRIDFRFTHGASESERRIEITYGTN